VQILTQKSKVKSQNFMIQVKQIYRCSICGNIVEVLYAGGGTLVCCGKPMELLIEKTEDVGKEKHVPVIEKTEKGVKVKVGSVPHPMEENHYIQWIELIADGVSLRKFLKPGDKPEAEFEAKAKKIEAREYCNIHGLWKSK
jgi:superoxide reductase